MRPGWWWGAVLVLSAAACARELDPAACGARFDVQRDKIIRTEESREMGARYLSELDVGARDECLRLCCETDGCDVFVYEEKGAGSCYLFNCGPPEDFRCKFTAHSNFSSGVMALSRRLAELQDAEHRQLATLRSATSSTSSTSTSTSTTSSRPPSAPPAGPLAHQPPPGPGPSRCSRYQFECVRDGECVAVYNACDGVAQCADGSDEAPELGCPSPALTPTPVTSSPDRWPHRLVQAQVQPPRRYAAATPPEGGGPHIFSHKGGLVQEAESGVYAPFESPVPAPWPRRPWPPPSSGGESGAWGGAGEWGEPRRAWPVPPRPDPEMPVYVPGEGEAEGESGYGAHGRGTLRDSAKKGPSPASAPPAPDLREEPRPTPAPTPAPQSLPVLSAHTHKHDGGRSAQHHKPPDEEHEGLSERPPAAVLLLVLGVLVTATLAGTLACRARAATRRLRHGRTLAHDADYLVNGMYL